MSGSLKILLCNERFIFRYGVDRILLMLGQELLDQGHEVVFVCGRCDERIREKFSDCVHVFDDVVALDVVGAETAGRQSLEQILKDESRGHPVDVMLTGGWPFYSVAQLGRRLDIPTVFIDAGAVPHNGISGTTLRIQQEVRRLRANCLPYYSRVLSISEFIKDSQTLPERGTKVGVEVVHLGVDHLGAAVFQADKEQQKAENKLLDEIRELSRQCVPLVLNLGRYEPTGYKNSPAIFDYIRELKACHDNVLVLFLGDDRNIDVPRRYRENCKFLGFISDEMLAKIMQIVAVGVSTSLWEGFNLPVGEMQYGGKPVLALNIGAHPEVIMHPWCLASDIAELVRKSSMIISGQEPEGVLASENFKQYRKRFVWRNTINRYIEVFQELVNAPLLKERQQHRLVFIDVSNSSRDTANSGVTRVTRRLSAQLQQLVGPYFQFIWWDTQDKCYRFVGKDRREYLASYRGPGELMAYLDFPSKRLDTDSNLELPFQGTYGKPILFLPEVAMDGQAGDRVSWAKTTGLDIAAILYDLIPVNHPELCDEMIVDMFPNYLKSFATVDLLICISKTTSDHFLNYIDKHDLDLQAKVVTQWLPGQFSNEQRRLSLKEVSDAGATSILCISTIEPRKNHVNLLEAFLQLLERCPDLDVTLTLIGNSYHGAPELADHIRRACEKEPRLTWLGVVNDDLVAAEIDKATFLVYPSLVEGFGLPIMESMWMGRPCLCHNQGVMAELAADGGCLVVNMLNVEKISYALERLAIDRDLLDRLKMEASRRPISDWQGYACEIASNLVQVGDPQDGNEHWQQRRSLVALDGEIEQETARLRQIAEGIQELKKAVSPKTIHEQHKFKHRQWLQLRPRREGRVVLSSVMHKLYQRSQKEDVTGKTLRQLASRTRVLRTRLRRYLHNRR